MKTSELFKMDLSALSVELHELLKAQFKMRMQIATQQSKDTAGLKKARRATARVKTIMHEKSRMMHSVGSE